MFVRDSVDNIDLLRSLVELSNGVVSNQLDATNNLLGVFLGLLAFFGIAISFWLAHLERKVSKIWDKINDKAKQISELDERIHHNIDGLYSQLREEESRTYLRRLKVVPQDIVNIIPILLSRELNSSFFSDLKGAYSELRKFAKQDDIVPGTEVPFSTYYAQVFIQHFLYEAMMDDDVRELVMGNLDDFMANAFENDIIQSSVSFCEVLSTDKVHFNKVDVLYKFIDAINQSQYKSLPELKNILFEQISPSSLLPEVLERFHQNNVVVTMFND